MERVTHKYHALTKGTHVVDFRAYANDIKSLNPTAPDRVWFTVACTNCS